MRVPFATAFVVLAVSCHSGPKTGSGAGAAPPPSAGDRSGALPSASSGATDDIAAPGSATARLARCGWGPIKAEPGAGAPPFAIALVDVETRAPLRGLHLIALELAAGTDVVAKMGARATIRVQDGAASYSFGAAGTHELDELLPAGSYRLRASASLDRSVKVIASRKPSRCSVALASDEGPGLVATGSVDPQWENE